MVNNPKQTNDTSETVIEVNCQPQVCHSNPWKKSAKCWLEIDSPVDQGRIMALGAYSYGPKIARRVNALKKCLRERKNLEAMYFRELHLLEARLNHLLTPLYDNRADIISGATCTSDDESDTGDDFLNAEKKTVQEADAVSDCNTTDNSDDTAEKGIPDFWKTVLMKSGAGDQIEEHDEIILSYLKDIRTLYTDNGYRIEFQFSPNPFFTNSILSCSCRRRFDRILFDICSPICKFSNIEWKQGKNVTVELPNTRRAKKGKTSKENSILQLSVFHLFQSKSFVYFPPYLTNYIKDRLITRAVLYYTGDILTDPHEELLVDVLNNML